MVVGDTHGRGISAGSFLASTVNYYSTGVDFSFISYILVHPNVEESDVISQSSAGT